MRINRRPLSLYLVQGESINKRTLYAVQSIFKKFNSSLTHNSLPCRSMGSAQMKSIVSSESKGTPSTTAAFFKARSMPNFKALHEKISSKIGGTPSGDKENSIAAVNDATESKRRMSGKGAYRNVLISTCV